jgi:uncharacterized Fe-S center protein
MMHRFRIANKSVTRNREDAPMKPEATFTTSEDTLIAFLRQRWERVFKARDRVAVKLHMGEPGNRYYLPADFTRRVVSVLRECRCNPFVFDSPVVYPGPRNAADSYLRAAAEHGYTEAAIGAPIIVSNRSEPLAGRAMTYHACTEPLEADGVVLLTHVKGHLACGMGGAIKNVGMGCMAKETKGAIHTGGEPVYTDGCTGCGTCVENCPTENIRVDGDRPTFGCTWCPGCSNCALVCPERCIVPKTGFFDELLAEAAVLAHDRFKKRYAVNVLRNISKLCDCVADSGPIILGDVGFVCADDMLTADVATLDMVRSASGRDDLFAEYCHHSPWEHVRAAARFMERDATASIRTID